MNLPPFLILNVPPRRLKITTSPAALTVGTPFTARVKAPKGGTVTALTATGVTLTAAGDGLWSGVAPADPGALVLSATGTDAKGKALTATRTVSVTAAPVTATLALLISPTAPRVGDTVTITGVVTGGTATAFTSISADIGGVAQTLSGTGLTRTFTASVAGALSVMGAVSVGGRTVSGVASAVVEEADVPGLGLPQEASARITLLADLIDGVEDGSALAAWTDPKSGIVWGQATAARQPIFRAAGVAGRPSVQFDGSNDFMLASDLTPIADMLGSLSATDKHFSIATIYSGVASTDSNTCVAVGVTASNAAQTYAMSYAATGRVGGSLSLPYEASVISVHVHTEGNKGPSDTTWIARDYVNGSCIGQGNGVSSTADLAKIALGAGSPAGYYACATHVIGYLVWDTDLSPAEVIALQRWICDRYDQPTPWAGAPFILFAGDSQTNSIGASVASKYPVQAANGLGLKRGQWTNLGITSLSMTTMADRVSTFEVPLIRELSDTSVVVAAFEWENIRGASNTEIKPSYAAKIMAEPNATLLMGTSISANTDEGATATARASHDATVLANAGGIYGDVIVPLHQNPEIGVTGAWAAQSTTSTYYADGAHPNNAGCAILAGIWQPYIQAAIDAL